MAEYVQGDTVWLRCSFYDRYGALYDPVSVSLKLYDPGRVQIGTTYTTAIVHVGTGVYECAVVLPLGKLACIGEWTGVDSNGYNQVARGEIHPQWSADLVATTADYLLAENISVADTGGRFIGTKVEDVLAELADRITALEP